MLDAAPDTPSPVTLTAWDMSFLKGLYAAPATVYAPAQRSRINRDMARALERQGDAPPPKR